MSILCVEREGTVFGLAASVCREMPGIGPAECVSSAADAIRRLEDRPADIVLLDAGLPDTDAPALAAAIREKWPDAALVFIADSAQYALAAFEVHASGYILKPVRREKLAAELEYAAGKGRPRPGARVSVRTFGRFELFMDGEPVSFARAKAKELFAYLVDNRGMGVTRADAFAALWDGGVYDRPMQKQLDVVIRSLRSTLTECGLGALLEMKHGSLRVRPELMDCDLYRFLDGDADAVNSYRGEYMSAYSWASLTEAAVSRALDEHPES